MPLMIQFPGRAHKLKAIPQWMLAILISSTLIACGGGGGGGGSDSSSADSTVGSVVGGNNNTNNNTTSEETVPVSGAAVKGPLVNATVTVYLVDPMRPNAKGEQIAQGSTDDKAQLQLAINESYLSESFLLLEYTGGKELNGNDPVIPVLRTVISTSQIRSQTPIYATPLTTLTIDYALNAADKVDNPSIVEKNRDGLIGNNDGFISIAEFEAALAHATIYVKDSFGFGVLDDEIDIFTHPPMLTAGSDQTESLNYRTAIESFAAVVDLAETVGKAKGSDVDTMDIVDGIAADMLDGEIDGANDGDAIAAYDGMDKADLSSALEQDPATLTTPGTLIPISDLNLALAAEADSLDNNVTPETLEKPATQPVETDLTKQDPVDPVDPQDPVDPVDPQDPVDPVDPQDPVDPVDPQDPVDPVDPQDPVDPVDPQDPVDPVDPQDPVDPVDPQDPVDPVDPQDPVDPVEPVDPGPTTVEFSWDAPTQRADGDSLQASDIDGYDVYYIRNGSGDNSGTLIEVTNGTTQEVTVELSIAGTYTFAVYAYDTEGNYSEMSSTASITVD